MIFNLIIFLGALILTIVLFLISFLGFLYCDTIKGFWFGSAWVDYCKAVAPNIGVTGLQTLLVSIFVVTIANRLRQAADYRRRIEELNKRRLSTGRIHLQDLLNYKLNKNLYGFNISNDEINLANINNARFVHENRPSKLSDVKITESDLLNLKFGDFKSGCQLQRVEIIGGSLRNISFRNCAIIVERQDKPFIKDAQCTRLDFRGATLKAVDLSDASIAGALFWGAKFTHLSQMPKAQEQTFGEFVEPITDPELGSISQVKTEQVIWSDIKSAFLRGNLQDGTTLLRKVLIIEFLYRIGRS